MKRKVWKVYRLYIWNFNRASAGPQRERGRCIGEFAMYKELLAEAQRRTRAAGYPVSRWMELYDWNV